MARFISLVVAAFLTFAAGPARAQEFVMKIATVAPADTPWSQLLDRYKKAVEEKSGGRIKVKLFLGGTLGDENEAVLKCKRGQVEAVGASTGAMASQVPELNVIELPYLFRTYQEADTVIDEIVSPRLDKLMPKYGLVLGFWSENGYRHFGSKTRPIKRPEDLKGLKMRSQESPIHLSMYKALGASPVPIATTEVLTALNSGTVDGFDQATLYALAASWHKSIKHFTVSNHIYQPALIVFNKEWFDKLPADLQKIVLEEGRGAIQSKGRKAVRKIQDELLEVLASEKVAVYKLTDAEMRVFEDRTKGVRTEFRKTQSKDASALLDEIEKKLAAMRK